LFDSVTVWPADGLDGDDLWVRTSIDLTGITLSTVVWGLGVDNGFKLYAKGVLVGEGNAEGFTFCWEYSGGFGGALVPGINVIDVALEDHGGATAFDMEITGDTAPPMPTTKDDCKKGGWATYGVFKNQGDCVSYVATGGKNPPAN
jgi:hypothetical protein